jgi:hypothetical protein
MFSCRVALAQPQTVIQYANFSTKPSPQSMWNGGVAPSYTTPFIGVQAPPPNLPATYSASLPPGGGTVLGVSGTASVSLNSFQAGFTLGAAATGGTVSARVPITITYNLPKVINSGQAFTVSTSYVNGGNTSPLLLTNGAQYSGSFNAVANVNATGSLSVTTPVGNLNSGPITLLNLNKSYTQTVDQSNPSVTLFNSQYASASLQVPTQINTSSTAFSAPNTLTSSGNSSPFLSGNLNLANIVAGALTEGALSLNGSVSESFNLGTSSNGANGTATLNYNLITANLQVGPSITQDFALTANAFPITLVSSWGEVESGNVGDTFTFTAPNSIGPETITTYTDIDNTFNNNTGLGLGTGFDYSLLGASASLTGNAYLLGYNVGSINANASVGPLDSETFNIPGLNTGNLLSVYNQSFPLAFNTPEQQLAFTVVPEPSGLVHVTMLLGTLLLWQWRRWRRARHVYG